MTELLPITTWSTSGSMPASSRVLPMTSAHSAAFIDGLNRTALPAASAADSLRSGIVNGKFHGREQRDDAQGLHDREDVLVGVGAEGLAERPVADLGVVVEDRGALVDLGQRLGPGLAHLRGDDPGRARRPARGTTSRRGAAPPSAPAGSWPPSGARPGTRPHRRRARRRARRWRAPPAASRPDGCGPRPSGRCRRRLGRTSAARTRAARQSRAGRARSSFGGSLTRVGSATATQQATRWPGATSVSGGASR